MAEDVAPPMCNGRYRLVDTLGEGGMAVVYRAYDALLDTWRAIKVLSPKMTKNRKVRERFLNEARTMAQLHHKNIVGVHDVGVDGETVYLVMEILDGGSVADRVKALGPLPPRMASQVVQAILAGLGEAHRKKIVHRDIKPHNVLVATDGVPKITDFGIARVSSSEHELTKTGAVIGTWAYMAPEQRSDAKSVTRRADIYACGATLYAIMTGKDPFDLFSVEVHKKAFAGQPEALCEVIAKACRYEPDDRYDSCDEMLEALALVHSTLPDDPLDTPPLVMAIGAGGKYERPDTDGYSSSLDTGPLASITYDASALEGSPPPSVGAGLQTQAEAAKPPTLGTLGDIPSVGDRNTGTFGDTTETVSVAVKGMAVGVAGMTGVMLIAGVALAGFLVVGGYFLYQEYEHRLSQMQPQIVMVGGVPTEIPAGEEVPEGAEPAPADVKPVQKLATKKSSKKRSKKTAGTQDAVVDAAPVFEPIEEPAPEDGKAADEDSPVEEDGSPIPPADGEALEASDGDPAGSDGLPQATEVAEEPTDDAVAEEPVFERTKPWPSTPASSYKRSVPAAATQLCVYRTTQMVGGGVPTWVYIDNQEVGPLRGGKYFCKLVTPGMHQVFVAAPGFKEDYPSIAAGARQSFASGAGKTWVGEVRLIEGGMKSAMTQTSAGRMSDTKAKLSKWAQ